MGFEMKHLTLVPWYLLDQYHLKLNCHLINIIRELENGYTIYLIVSSILFSAQLSVYIKKLSNKWLLFVLFKQKNVLVMLIFG